MSSWQGWGLGESSMAADINRRFQWSLGPLKPSLTSLTPWNLYLQTALVYIVRAVAFSVTLTS